MPKLSGLSHALAAILVVIIGPFLKRFLELLITTKDIVTAVATVAELISSHPQIPFESDMTISLLYLTVVALLAFIYGYMYHVTRHTKSDI
jgi:hypothetical protein